MEACLDLIDEVGIAPVTADAVCARAGLTKRYFYESFSDREALLSALLEDFFTDTRAQMLRALPASEQTPRARANTIARVLIEVLEGDSRRARLYIESAGQPALQARREQAYETFTQLLLDAVPDPRTPPSGPGDEPVAADRSAGVSQRSLAAFIIVAGTTQAVISWLRGTHDLPRESVIAEIARMIIAAVEPARDAPG